MWKQTLHNWLDYCWSRVLLSTSQCEKKATELTGLLLWSKVLLSTSQCEKKELQNWLYHCWSRALRIHKSFSHRMSPHSLLMHGRGERATPKKKRKKKKAGSRKVKSGTPHLRLTLCWTSLSCGSTLLVSKLPPSSSMLNTLSLLTSTWRHQSDRSTSVGIFTSSCSRRYSVKRTC